MKKTKMENISQNYPVRIFTVKKSIQHKSLMVSEIQTRVLLMESEPITDTHHIVRNKL